MSKKAKKKARAKSEHERDDGTEVYDEGEDEEDEQEWVEEDDKRKRAAKGAREAEQPEDYAGMTEEETRDMPEPAAGEAPPDPKDQEPVEPNYDILINDPPFQPAGDVDAQEKYAEPPAPIPGMEPPRTLGDEATEPQPQQLQPGERGKKKEEV